VRVPKQHNAYDCGVFCCMFAAGSAPPPPLCAL
jgi:Ulp1 family protease